jgi:hypothetical protein
MLSVSRPIATEAQNNVDAVVPAGKPFAEDHHGRCRENQQQALVKGCQDEKH